MVPFRSLRSPSPSGHVPALHELAGELSGVATGSTNHFRDSTRGINASFATVAGIVGVHHREIMWIIHARAACSEGKRPELRRRRGIVLTSVRLAIGTVRRQTGTHRPVFGGTGTRIPIESVGSSRGAATSAVRRRTLLHRRIRAAAINRVLSRCHRGRGVEFARARMQHDSVKTNQRLNAPSTPPCLPTRPGQ